MSVKSLLLGFTTAAAATAGLLASATAASALSIGSSYTVSGQGIFSPDSIDFTNDGKLLVTQASGDFASIAPDFNSFTFTLANAIDIATLGSTPYKLIDFGAPNDEFDFTATKAYFDPGTKSYRFGGFFGSAPDESGDGEIDALKLVFIDDETSEGGFTGTFTVIPEDEIPTPALLPGIIGMGIAAIRKRREDSAQADA